ncbi:hypothetical protein VTN96DRAFT_1090 [Rasamsonia emersonii]
MATAARRVEAAQHHLLPAIVEQLAAEEPDALWGEFPRSSTSLSEGFESISYAQFANAVNGVAHHITQALGRRDTEEPLAYLAPNDPRCAITLVAAMRAGFTIFLISERNSVAANLKLFDDVQCSTLVTTDRTFAPVRNTLMEREVTLIELPSLQTLLHEPQATYRYEKELAAAANEAAFMIHTSGSTGFPKPVSISHKIVAKFARTIGLPAPEGYETLSSMMGNNRNVLLLPLGHPAGVNFGILNTFFNNTTVILPLPGKPPTAEALLEILQHTHADWAAMAPLTLETISKNTTLLEGIARHLKMLLFSGGSLPKVFGDVIAAKIKLTSQLGSSETGPLPAVYRHGYDFERDWNYLQFHPAVGARFDPLPGDDVFELVFDRTPESEPYQPVFTTYPHLKEFRTKDLFTPHPSVPGLWTHAARSDDVIVFLNGEKVNPVTFESHIAKHPEVAAAVMFGHQRFEPGLLIELQDDQQKSLSAAERAQIIQRLWPTIEAANRILPGHAQVSQSHICFTDPGRPVLRTLKGSLRRQATLDLYAAKINQVYADVEAMWTSIPNKGDLGTTDSIRGLVRESLAEATRLGNNIDDNADLFSQGIDSLQTLRLVRQLRIKTGLRSIQPSLVYLHPSITALTEALDALAHQIESSETEQMEKRRKIRAETLQKYLDVIASRKEDIILNKPGNSTTDDVDQVVILTGSTGSIGSYILNALLSEPKVKHVYCLNRSPDSGTLQKERNAKLDPILLTSFPPDRVTFLTADLSEPQTLGLPTEVYQTLRETVTLIIHNAWLVDFNLPLQSFESQLAGVVNLAVLDGQSTRRAAFVFLSSISATMNFDLTGTANNNKVVPEAILTDIDTPAPVGYAESKYIAERLLEAASTQLNLRQKPVILRLGQIAGAARSAGRWNPTDWIPRLILGSRQLGVIPNSLEISSGGHEQKNNNDIDWLPIDTLADVVVDIGLHAAAGDDLADPEQPVVVLHPLNPHRASWETLVPSIIASLQKQKQQQETPLTIEVVSPTEWLIKLRASAASLMEEGSEEAREALLRSNPALRLLEFFMARFSGAVELGEGLQWETNRAERISEKLRAAEAIDGQAMKRWVEQWFEH